MEEGVSKPKLAIVGGGVAGVTAAWALRHTHDVTLFEKNGYIGGHTNTIDIRDSSGKWLPIDTGFIVCNPKNYPNFYRFLDQLGISLRNTEMSFGYRSDETGLAYIGPGLGEFMRMPGSLLHRDFLRILMEQRRFNSRAISDLSSQNVITGTLGEYIERLGCSSLFVEHYLVPISAAVWSSSDQGILDFPTHTFLTFFRNHGMLELSKRPQWQTVVGGSRAYIAAFYESFRGDIRIQSAVTAIARDESGVTIQTKDSKERFDFVVLACHADEALALLEDPSDEERSLLGSWRYSQNETVLHSDSSVLPADRRNWASWNYYRKLNRDPLEPLSATYYMNLLQGLQAEQDYFVTLNSSSIAPEKIHYRTTYSHPIYTADSVSSQRAIRELSGTRMTYYCGSYLGYGFHEDAVTSALDVAKLLGGSL